MATATENTIHTTSRWDDEYLAIFLSSVWSNQMLPRHLASVPWVLPCFCWRAAIATANTFTRNNYQEKITRPFFHPAGLLLCCYTASMHTVATAVKTKEETHAASLSAQHLTAMNTTALYRAEGNMIILSPRQSLVSSSVQFLSVGQKCVTLTPLTRKYELIGIWDSDRLRNIQIHGPGAIMGWEDHLPDSRGHSLRWDDLT